MSLGKPTGFEGTQVIAVETAATRHLNWRNTRVRRPGISTSILEAIDSMDRCLLQHHLDAPTGEPVTALIEAVSSATVGSGQAVTESQVAGDQRTAFILAEHPTRGSLRRAVRPPRSCHPASPKRD